MTDPNKCRHPKRKDQDMAKQNPNEEPKVVGAGIGGAVGGVIGALVGGPIGAAVGAGASGWIGHEIEKDMRKKK
jgi:uncharacterized protein YcfJ